jgi:hypothetical protein
MREWIGLVSLPGEVTALWKLVKPWILPLVAAGLVGGVVAFFRTAPLWQIALLAVTVFAGCSLIVFLWLHFSPVVKGVLRRKGVLDSPDVSPEADRSPEELAEERLRERIEKWKSVIPEYDLDDTDDRRRFLRTDTYSQMKQYLPPEVIEMFEAQRTLHVGNEARGETAYHYTLLEEVARIENERVFNAPGPITKQATPGELKALCFHLADELDDEHRSYLNSEQMVMLWEQELKEQGLSESEIDQKAESARDEHLVETLNRYNKHLKGRLLNLHDALGPQGWFGAIDRSRFENLSDPHYMSNLAKRLREVGGKLPDS